MGKDCKKVLAKHVKDKHAPDPDNVRFKVWMEASHRSWCMGCASSFSNRMPHVCRDPRDRLAPFFPKSSAVCDAPAVELELKTDVACVLPGWMEIFSTSIPSVKRIPQQCRVVVAKAFTTIMRNCCLSSSMEQEIRAWKLQFMFPKCVLRLQPEIRGGKKKKLRRNETLKVGLLERLRRWNEGRVHQGDPLGPLLFSLVLRWL